MNRYLVKDIHSLTHINDKILDKMSNISELCVCDYINELDMIDEDVLNVNIGIGTISFLIAGDEIQYSFKPSKSLEGRIISVLENKQSPLLSTVESSLENKVSATYKDLI